MAVTGDPIQGDQEEVTGRGLRSEGRRRRVGACRAGGSGPQPRSAPLSTSCGRAPPPERPPPAPPRPGLLLPPLAPGFVWGWSFFHSERTESESGQLCAGPGVPARRGRGDDWKSGLPGSPSSRAPVGPRWGMEGTRTVLGDLGPVGVQGLGTRPSDHEESPLAPPTHTRKTLIPGGPFERPVGRQLSVFWVQGEPTSPPGEILLEKKGVSTEPTCPALA